MSKKNTEVKKTPSRQTDGQTDKQTTSIVKTTHPTDATSKNAAAELVFPQPKLNVSTNSPGAGFNKFHIGGQNFGASWKWS